jgi:hypothetical protein
MKTESEIKSEIENLTQILKDSQEYNRKFGEHFNQFTKSRQEGLAHKIQALKWTIE